MTSNTSSKNKDSSKIWGGRFEASPDEIMQDINSSIDIDQRLWRQDIAGSKAHCEMLIAQNIISNEDGQSILSGLSQIENEIEQGTFNFRKDLEDIHMNVEHRLKEIIGDAAGRLHTARSRNDQVATSFRLWLRDAIEALIEKITTLQATMAGLANEHKDKPFPGFTHLQTAQPVTLGKHLDAYVQMLERDKGRLTDCRKRVNENPLGAAALAGTPFPIDREHTAKTLGFDKVMTNTMDAVAARDFANEFLFCTAQCGLHLSRLAEEIIFWSSAQFGFMVLSDAWSTGSSIMPQKKNPDAAELIRGKTGRLTGNLMQMMMVMKGLPMTYNKDMQEDKASVFESYDIMDLCLSCMNGMMDTASWNFDVMKEQAESGFSTATRLADWLVMTLNMPFRDAHHVTGQIVKIAETKGVKLYELSLEDMQGVEQGITDDIFSVLKL